MEVLQPAAVHAFKVLHDKSEDRLFHLLWTQKNGKAGQKKRNSSASTASAASFTTIDFHMGLCQYSLQMVSMKDDFDQVYMTLFEVIILCL